MNLLGVALRYTIAANSAGKLASQGALTSDNGTFNNSVSSTNIYCKNLEVYNNATVERDMWVRGNQYLNIGMLFGSEIDID